MIKIILSEDQRGVDEIQRKHGSRSGWGISKTLILADSIISMWLLCCFLLFLI